MFNDADTDCVGYITSAQFAAMDAAGFRQAVVRGANPLQPVHASLSLPRAQEFDFRSTHASIQSGSSTIDFDKEADEAFFVGVAS